MCKQVKLLLDSYILEGMARYAGQLPVAAKSIGLRPLAFCPLRFFLSKHLGSVLTMVTLDKKTNILRNSEIKIKL